MEDSHAKCALINHKYMNRPCRLWLKFNWHSKCCLLTNIEMALGRKMGPVPFTGDALKTPIFYGSLFHNRLSSSEYVKEDKPHKTSGHVKNIEIAPTNSISIGWR